jgi:hypothetical protein
VAVTAAAIALMVLAVRTVEQAEGSEKGRPAAADKDDAAR